MRNGSLARRAFAGLFLTVALMLAFAGVASAQSSSQSSQSSQGSSGSSATTGSTIGGSSTARTGFDTWLPLMVGGLVVTVAVATRVGLSRAAART